MFDVLHYYEAMLAILNMIAHAHGWLPMLQHIPLLLGF